jgi:MFS family permease
LCLSQIGPNVHVFWALYVFAALAAVGASPITYTRAIIHVFNRHRGLAIGIAMSGTGLGAAVAPPLLEYVIRIHGWQAGYQLLALILFAIAGAVFLLFKGTAFDSRRSEPVSQSDEPAERVRSPRKLGLLWPICLAIFIISLSINGYVIHLVPMLTGSGLTSQQAAGLTAFIGLAVILGRLTTGYLLDHFSTGLVGCLIFIAAAGGIFMLGNPSSETILISILLIGFTIGAEVDIVAYLVSRLFPQKSYARYFSWVYCAFMLGAGFSPLIAAYIYDRDGSYGVFFLLSIAALLFISMAFLGLHLLQHRFRALQFA